ncbi:MAG: hypothetical protein ABIJ18_04345 [archaeon]
MADLERKTEYWQLQRKDLIPGYGFCRYALRTGENEIALDMPSKKTLTRAVFLSAYNIGIPLTLGISGLALLIHKIS